MKISLIIPVYNVEDYLSKCLENCLQQDLQQSDYEIIIIDDGSTDNSLQIARTYECKFSNIKIISKKNGGLSSARNLGLRLATGEYVWFIDSDDWIKTNSLNELISLLDKNQLDCIWFDHAYIDEDNNCLNSKFLSSPRELSSIKSGEQFLHEVFNFQTYVCCFIWRKKVLVDNSLLFYEGIYYEDIEFTPRAIYKMNKVMYYPVPVYNYLKRNGSILNSYNEKKIDDLLFVLRKTILLINQLKFNFNTTYLENLYTVNLVGLLWLLSDTRASFKVESVLKNLSLFNHTTCIMPSKIGFKFACIIFLFKLKPSFILFVFKILRIVLYKHGA